MAKPVSRRYLVCALGLAWLAAAPWVPRLASAADSSVVRERLAALFGDPASARVIGEAYLAEIRAARPDELAAAVRELKRASITVREFKARCRADFAAGNIVTVRGWVLARTEAQLCAVAALA